MFGAFSVPQFVSNVQTGVFVFQNFYFLYRKLPLSLYYKAKCEKLRNHQGFLDYTNTRLVPTAPKSEAVHEKFLHKMSTDVLPSVTKEIWTEEHL